MNYKPHLIALMLISYCSDLAFGQIYEHVLPLSATENILPITRFEVLSPLEHSSCKNKAVSSLEFTQFACPISTDFSPDNSGQWVETPSGRVWRLGIRSADAQSIYLTMGYELLPGIKMFVYRPGYEDLQGAFTSRNNNISDVLSVAPISGDSLIIELNVPTSRHSYGDLIIKKVYHGFFDIFSTSSTQRGKYSNDTDCEEDVNCANGSYWQTEKRSVVKIISNGVIGTGTLVGNTSGSDTPYVLTAAHLISSMESASEAIFFFNYETSGCREQLAPDIGTLSGAVLRSTAGSRLDFTLLELNEVPPSAFRPFYSGWDARNRIAQKTTCIHHPFGGPKQIAIEYHPLENEDVGQGFDANSTWKVSHWEVGVTEAGSSGAPLFNEHHRIVGTLTGGRSSCGYVQDDFFTKVSAAWETYTPPTKQLKYWLDPTGTGRMTLDGYDPYGFNAEYCDTAWNFLPRDELALHSEGLSWGWISGHNSAGDSQFAERFEFSGVAQIKGIYLNVAKAYGSNPLSNIEIKVWKGSLYPEEESYSKLVYLKDLQPGKVNYVGLDSVLMHSGAMFVGYKVNYTAVSDTFALFHAVNRKQGGPSSSYVYRNTWVRSENSDAWGISTSIGVGISLCYGKSLDPTHNTMVVFPNPSSDFVALKIPVQTPVQTVKCYDASGRSVPCRLRLSEFENRVEFNLPSGVYYLKVLTKDESFETRFVVLND